MNGYFKPLRRKLGVITLLLACVLTTGWIRSLFMKDSALIARPYPDFIRLDSCGGYFKWSTVRNSRIRNVPTSWHSGSFNKTDIATLFDHSQFKVETNWDFCDIHYGDVTPPDLPGEGVTYVIVPYLWAAIPLIALSTYLLLTKPPPRAAKAPT